MSKRTTQTLIVAGAIALMVGLVVYLALDSRAEDAAEESAAAAREAAQERREAAEEEAREDAAREELAEAAAREEAAHHDHSSHAPPPESLAAIATARGEAEPIVERFWEAFSRYEVGDTSPEVEAALEATATPAFAGEITAEAPRVPPTIKDFPDRARLVGLDYLPLDSDPRTEEFVSAQFIATLERADERSELTIAVRRGALGWRVRGLGE